MIFELLNRLKYLIPWWNLKGYPIFFFIRNTQLILQEEMYITDMTDWQWFGLWKYFTLKTTYDEWSIVEYYFCYRSAYCVAISGIRYSFLWKYQLIRRNNYIVLNSNSGWFCVYIATLGFILDSQLCWESGKSHLARWSHKVVLFSVRTHPTDQPV